MYTILIVDDERPAQTFLKAICQKYCPAFDTILLSGSADDALRLMAQQHVHVLVTDISMPGINGIELAQRVRQLYPRTHTVIVSGYAEFEFARGAIQAGVDDYLLKPVEIQFPANSRPNPRNARCRSKQPDGGNADSPALR